MNYISRSTFLCSKHWSSSNAMLHSKVVIFICNVSCQWWVILNYARSLVRLLEKKDFITSYFILILCIMGRPWPWECSLGLDSVWPWPWSWSVGLGLECSGLVNITGFNRFRIQASQRGWAPASHAMNLESTGYLPLRLPFPIPSMTHLVSQNNPFLTYCPRLMIIVVIA